MSNEKINITTENEGANGIKYLSEPNPFIDYYSEPVLVDKYEANLTERHKNMGATKLMGYQYKIGESSDSAKTPYTVSVDAIKIPEGKDVYNFFRLRNSDVNVLPKDLAIKTLDNAREQLNKDCAEISKSTKGKKHQTEIDR